MTERRAAGWVVYIHPEGLVYYYHPVHHVVTDANLTDVETYSKISRWVDEFYEVKKERALELPDSFELVLELDLKDEGGKYYLVDHDKQRIFYFDEVNTGDIDLPDVYSEDHLKRMLMAFGIELQLEGQYWNHIESFPMHHPLPSSADTMIMNILTHAWADRATSSLSTSPFSVEDCKEFINIVKTSGESEKGGYHTWVVARLLKSFTFARFINRFGEAQGARLSRTQSFEAMSQTYPSLLFRLISWVLFNQPRKDLSELNPLWVDNIVYTEHWQVFNVAKVEEWYGVCAMGDFLTKADHRKHGLQFLAIVLSLPRAFLMWALAAMVVSLISANFEYLFAWQAVVPNTFMVCLMAIVFWAVRD
ncbi:hypothetical protein BU17DRAFT_70542 [Hysterangium stoloniferum]|nr:hypothetical protein BU17DRAFT_70542 [Hysterangium stoloniferum]